MPLRKWAPTGRNGPDYATSETAAMADYRADKGAEGRIAVNLPIQGTAATQEVPVSANGTFQTRLLELKLPVGASRPRYTVRASAVETEAH